MKVKSPAKNFTSNVETIEDVVVRTMDRISEIVGSSLGPHGKNVIIESDLAGIPNKNTKDGVTIFKSLGSRDAYEHLIIEQTRDVAVRTVNEAGDGTTSATIIAAALIKNLLAFCKENRKYSPQKVTREIAKLLKEHMVPFIESNSINITAKKQDLLEKVATVSANGDEEMAKAVIQAFEEVGYGASSHVTIQELSGPSGYEVELIEGFPVNKGYEESIGKFHSAFINDQGNLRCLLDNPLFLLFDGKINDIVQVASVLQEIGDRYVNGDANYCNVVIVAHGFSEQVLTNLALNFQNPNTINIVPLSTPVNQIINSQTNFLMDLAAFTGAKIFDMNESILDADVTVDLGQGMERLEMYRFRTTVVGDPDETNIEVRAEEIEGQMKQSESKIEKALLEERLGKLTSGIARLKIYGASNGELKEKADRAEDAVCSVRAAINHGCLPGGGRVLLNLAFDLAEKNQDNLVIQNIVAPSLMTPFYKLLENAGYNEDEIADALSKMEKDRKKVFNVAEGEFGTEKKMGIYDATLAVKQSLANAVSIASVMGTLGGIVAEPRSHDVEKESALQEMDFQRNIDNAGSIQNEANLRG